MMRLQMKIEVNGISHKLNKGLTLKGLIVHFSLPMEKIAIERNLEIIPHANYADTILEEGDKIEIVHFIGGG
ncbi:MAG: sulfur carrier protein ThiS [Parvibaculales bacterium]